MENILAMAKKVVRGDDEKKCPQFAKKKFSGRVVLVQLIN